jgi:hypothetical protein
MIAEKAADMILGHALLPAQELRKSEVKRSGMLVGVEPAE